MTTPVGPSGGEPIGTGGLPPPATPPEEQTTAPLEIDTFVDSMTEMIESDDNIALLAKGQINLPPGRISLSELTALINKVIQKLKDAIKEQQALDPLISERFHRGIVKTAESLENLHSELIETVESWIQTTGPQAQAVINSYSQLEQATADFNTLMETTWGEDRAAIQDYNDAINQYNNLTPTRVQNIYNGLSVSQRNALLSGLTAQQIADMGGTEQAVVMQYLNQKISAFNQYASTRPNLQSAINNIQTATANYNAQVDQYNAKVDQINLQRAGFGLEPIDHFSNTPPANSNPLYTALSGQSLITAPPTLLPVTSRSTLAVPSVSQNGTIPLPLVPGIIPNISYDDMMLLNWIPVATTTFNYLSSFNRALDLAYALITAEQLAIQDRGFELTLPFGTIQELNPVFLASINAIGGAGLAAHALGLHSRNLEITLSRAIFQTVAQNLSFPASGRLFARLQFTALELLSRSSLMSSLPSIRFLASRFGQLGALNPAVQASIALAFAGQIGGLVSSGIVRGIVNGQINRLGSYSRGRLRRANRGLRRAQRRLDRAIRSGNPFKIARAVAKLERATTKLANATRLFNTFGTQAIGSFAAFGNQVAAALNLSLLGISTAQFARALGIPNLVPQIFAQVTHLDPSDLLIAMTAGSSITDILDNPISILFAKQSLANQLVFEMGYSGPVAAAIVNNAINNVVLAGVGIQSFSRLRNELREQFRAEGLNRFQANALANETAGLIRGDLGVQFLNVAFGLNFDRSLIASSVVNQLFGLDVGIAGAMLSNTVVRSLQYGGYGSRVRLRNELREQYRDLGLSRGDAHRLANQHVDFLRTVGLGVPLGQFPGLASVLIGGPLLQSIALGNNFIQSEMIQELEDRGLSRSQANFVSEQLLSLSGRNFNRLGGNALFELAIRNAIERAGSDGFETQREFRNAIRKELRSIGFNRKDARFLANSIAAFGLDGTVLSALGISSSGADVLKDSLVNELRSSGISGRRANRIAERAFKKAGRRGPFSSPDEFKNILKEEVFKATLRIAGESNGQQIFDRAVAHASTSSQILGLASLIEQITGNANGLHRPDLGTVLAQELKDQILNVLFGGSNVDEIEEKHNPLSVLNQIGDQLDRLTKDDETENLRKMIRNLQKLLAKLNTPNAELGFLLQSISDNPGNFFEATSSAMGAGNVPATQIPV